MGKPPRHPEERLSLGEKLLIAIVITVVAMVLYRGVSNQLELRAADRRLPAPSRAETPALSPERIP